MANNLSLVDQILALEAQKQTLMAQAKSEALNMAERAVNDLNNLGFHYRLVETDTTAQPRSTNKSTSTRSPRKGGISEQVLAAIQAAPDGLPRAGVLSALGANDTKAEQSISNALSNLKKAGKLTADNGVYKVV